MSSTGLLSTYTYHENTQGILRPPCKGIMSKQIHLRSTRRFTTRGITGAGFEPASPGSVLRAPRCPTSLRRPHEDCAFIPVVTHPTLSHRRVAQNSDPQLKVVDSNHPLLCCLPQPGVEPVEFRYYPETAILTALFICLCLWRVVRFRQDAPPVFPD